MAVKTDTKLFLLAFAAGFEHFCYLFFLEEAQINKLRGYEFLDILIVARTLVREHVQEARDILHGEFLHRLVELLVAEDNGDMQIVIVAPGAIRPLLQIVGQDRSEITGPAFSPDGSRLYFSSQRGASGKSEDGVTYEITGPF